MNRRRYIAYRLTWAGCAALLVTLVLFALAQGIGDLSQAPQTASNLPDVSNDFWSADDPLYVQYVDWVTGLLTLEWGTSIRFGEPVTGLLADRAKFTAVYLVPAVVLGTAASTAFGYVAAHRRGQLSDGVIRSGTYLVLAVPNFVIAGAFARYIERRAYELDARTFVLDAGLTGEWNLVWLTAATLILGTHVWATQLRQVRAQSSEHLTSDFARLLHAKGLGPLGIARHVLRAAAVPLTSLFVAETVGVLLVSVFVIEAVLGIPGIGYVTWQAAAINDGPVVLASSFLFALAVIAASVVEDIAAVVLDPRLDDE